jgi:predicted AlkP superfamily pyrophosphatase or phosphodiesterase
MHGKVIAVALKDRGSVLPAGHTANAAYWFYGDSEGKWVSSSYYMDKLPGWVTEYNASRKVNQYRRIWDTEKKIQTYVESGPDNNAFEGAFAGMDAPAFPYDIPALWTANGEYELLKSTPFGNSMTTDFALLALEKEALGTDGITDFLAISYSSTDYIGHRFGVNSKEVQDTYVRLDLELERLLKALDKQVGEDGYTLFLTADHGAMQPSAYLKEQKIPAGFEESLQDKNEFLEFVDFTYGTTDLIRNISNHQIFLNHRLLESLDLNPREVQESLAAELLSYEGIDKVYTAYQMHHQDYNEGIPHLLKNGYNQKLSGDVLWVPSPGYSNYGKTGSTHGTPQIYDTHVPLILFGKGIKPGRTLARTEIPDIAPTLSVLLGIAFPNGATGKPITIALE